MKRHIITTAIASLALLGTAVGSRLAERVMGQHERFLDERRAALPGLSDPFGVPAAARVVLENSRERFHEGADWKRNVVSTVFWVGELPAEHNPTPNSQSAWDQNWRANFGGYDDPEQRVGYLPAGFAPLLNPFYVALPYNDVTPSGKHRREASEVIPWFWESYRGDGISVCKDRWVAIHHEGRVCYAQWEDVGPLKWITGSTSLARKPRVRTAMAAQASTSVPPCGTSSSFAVVPPWSGALPRTVKCREARGAMDQKMSHF